MSPMGLGRCKGNGSAAISLWCFLCTRVAYHKRAIIKAQGHMPWSLSDSSQAWPGWLTRGLLWSPNLLHPQLLYGWPYLEHVEGWFLYYEYSIRLCSWHIICQVCTNMTSVLNEFQHSCRACIALYSFCLRNVILLAFLRPKPDE